MQCLPHRESIKSKLESAIISKCFGCQQLNEVSKESRPLLTHEKKEQVRDSQTEQVVIGGRVHRRVTHNHDTHDDVADDAGEEDDHVDYRYLET